MKTGKKTIYSEKDLAEAHVFAHDLTDIEKKEADDDIKLFRLARLDTMSNNKKLQSALFRLKLSMEDFVQQEIDDEKQNTGTFLQDYLKILDKKQIDFAHEISLHPTKLNQIINNKAMPNIALFYRLEKHSGGLLSAILWWKVFTKKMEADIKNDDVKRQIESDKVCSDLVFA